MISQTRNGTAVNIAELNAFAARGLVKMFDPTSQIFCYRLYRTAAGLVPEGTSHRYTIMALLGLHQFEEAGTPSPIDVKACMSRLLADTRWLNNLGDLGLLLWLVAQVAPEQIASLKRTLQVKDALARYPQGREGRTMELAWFLTGLSYAALASPEQGTDLKELAFETWSRLRKNWGGQGFFGHLNRQGGFLGAFRSRMGSFADQVYPIYALSCFWKAYGVPDALAIARECGDAICRVQGKLGQWWWHYDAARGEVLGRYPVYSVHQDAMAPMALFALGEAARCDYSPFIEKGLEWIAGKNELGYDMRAGSENMIWRRFFRPKFRSFLEKSSLFLGLRGDGENPRDLQILYECRPYHLGWLLYAFAKRENTWLI